MLSRSTTRARRTFSPRHVPARFAGQLLAFPAGLWLSLMVLAPAIIAIVLAFFSFDPLAGSLRFVGLGNIERLSESTELLTATRNTVVYTLLTVVPIMAIGLVIALGIHNAASGAAIYRTAYFLPAAATLAGTAVVWRWMFYPDTGIVDSVVAPILGVTDWLNTPFLALPAIAVVGCWQGIGTAMVMFLAGLSGVPRVLHEAARLDGAPAWHRFWSVTWPALGPATIFALITTTRDSLRVFDQVAVMTQGGPYGSSTTLAYLMRERGVAFTDIGGASVVNIVLLGLVLAVVFVQLRVFGRQWERAGSR